MHFVSISDVNSTMVVKQLHLQISNRHNFDEFLDEQEYNHIGTNQHLVLL
jgi:hypothetical protein